MRVAVATGKLQLLRGDRYKVVRSGAPPHRCYLKREGETRVDVEDAGFADGTCVVVAEAKPGEAVLEADGTVWSATTGVVGRMAGALRRLGLTEGASVMNGNVYEGVVVKTTKVAAGNHSDVDKSEVVHVAKPFVARDDATASGLLLAEAMKAGVDVNAVDAPVEVRLRKY